MLTIHLSKEPALVPLIFIVEFIFSAQLMLMLLFIYSFLLLIFGFNSFFVFKKNLKVKNSAIDLDLDFFSKEAPGSVDLSLVFYFVGC